MIAWFKIHWKPCLVGVAVVASFGAGWAASTKPDTLINEAAQVSTQTVWQKTVLKDSTRKTVKDTKMLPDGTTTVHEEETEVVKERTEGSGGTKVEEKTSKVTQVTSEPQWRAGLLVGGTLHLEPLGASLTLGATVDRKILGPFSLGLWALVQPQPLVVTAGLSASVGW